jgi:N6-L-threonylcarbamoyladenine synthase
MGHNFFLGIDTSNYTTSAALYDILSGEVIQSKLPLPVKSGELGLRQSDALFHHLQSLPAVMSGLGGKKTPLCALGVSTRPRNAEGSYMPCFLAGESFADSFFAITDVPVYKTSHQVGHILAALYGAGRLDLINESFAAFHISGGTTDMLLCSPEKDEIIKCERISGSADLKAGQLVDRVGVSLGLSFPCGVELEKLAAAFGETEKPLKIKIPESGEDFCFSGTQNKCETFIREGKSPEFIAIYVLSYIAEAVCLMIEKRLPENIDKILFCGGVMSNRLIRDIITKRFPKVTLIFTPPQFSADNAVGTAVFAALKSGEVSV